MAFSLFKTGLLARSSPSRVTTHAQCDDFPTSSPRTISGLAGGAMVVSSNRQADRKPSPRHPHYLAVAPGPGSFLSVVRSGLAESCVFGKQSLGPFRCGPPALPGRAGSRWGASLLPKLRDDYAEFLDHGCPDRLGMLFLPTCVGFGTGGVGAA